MGATSRRKGANGELEFIKILSQSFPEHEFSRNYAQAAKSGFDVIGLPGFGVEVKRYKRGRLYQLDWWDQVVDAVKPERLLPLLAYRFDRTEWCILVPAQWVVGNTVDRHDITCHIRLLRNLKRTIRNSSKICWRLRPKNDSLYRTAV